MHDANGQLDPAQASANNNKEPETPESYRPNYPEPTVRHYPEIDVLLSLIDCTGNRI